MTVLFHPFMCHVRILLTRVWHLHDCIIPPICVSCRNFTHTGMTPTWLYHFPMYVSCRDFTYTGRTPTWLYHSPMYVSCRDFTYISRTPTWLYHFTKIEHISLKKTILSKPLFNQAQASDQFLATNKLATNKAICLKTKKRNKSKMYF